ncbi:hypothetical protein [Lactobacillus crispatus]|uniref:hypothetical protein n=2 Tax=Lactobacillus crispatus TaxID=47770 RepID=UPI001F090E27|nr:hypothetical protein [Lactobacillus crispatus]
MDKEKPSIEVVVNYFKANIPGCGITDAEIDDLRQLYPKVSYKDMSCVFHQALNQHAMQPVSYMTRQLRILRPPTDPFNTQINQRTAYGKRIEKGTDWDAKQAEVDQSRGLNRQSYDQTHGKGAFDHKKRQECEELHQKFVELDRQAEQNKQPTQVAGYDAWSDEDKAWYDDLVEGVMHLIDEDEVNREKKKKEAAEKRKAKAEHARKLRDFARRA